MRVFESFQYSFFLHLAMFLVEYSDGSGLMPGLGLALSPGFLESPRPDFGRSAQARARPGPLVKSLRAQRALGI